MKNMGNMVRWPWKNKNSNPKWDTTKYYEFHGDRGYLTLDCIALHFEVANLLKKGHLQDLLSEKGKNTLGQRDAHNDDQPIEPTPKRTVNVITGGS